MTKYDQFLDISGILASEINFLAKAVSTDEIRYSMNFIRFFDNGDHITAVATDGRRMHVVSPLNDSGRQIYDIKDGFYRVLKQGKNVWLAKCAEAPGEFPNWSKVMPEGQPKFTTTFSGFSLSSRLEVLAPSASISLARLIRSFPEPTAINLSYLDSLGQSSWEVHWYAPNRAVKFVSGNMTGVVMPLSMEE